MPTKGPGVAARQGGGFRQGFGHFDEEHLEQSASTSAVQQKQLTQQNTQSSQHPAPAANPQSAPAQQAPPPREVSSFKDELLERPVKDVKQGLQSIFDLNSLLGINTADKPEEQERKKALNERFGQLTEEQQQVAKKLFQEKMQKDKLAEEEKAKQKQLAEAKKQEDIAPPSSPRKGPIGPGGPGAKLSGKKMAQELVERDRQQMSRLQTAG
jgi:hypothetical protein